MSVSELLQEQCHCDLQISPYYMCHAGRPGALLFLYGKTCGSNMKISYKVQKDGPCDETVLMIDVDGFSCRETISENADALSRELFLAEIRECIDKGRNLIAPFCESNQARPKMTCGVFLLKAEDVSVKDQKFNLKFWYGADWDSIENKASGGFEINIRCHASSNDIQR